MISRRKPQDSSAVFARRAARILAATAAAAVLMAMAPIPASAVSDQVPIGARGIAMGGAFSSIADDATALFWNPAGLPRIGHQEIMGTHANLFNAGINDNVLAFVLPLSLAHAVGVDWYHSGFDDSELQFGENRFDLSYGLKLGSYLMAGATAKYVTRETNLDGSTVRRGGGAGVDLGLLGTPSEGLRMALVGQDVFNTRVTYSSGEGTVIAFPRNVLAAASYTFRRGLTLATDVDDRWHLGGEFLPIAQLALRAGWEHDRKGSEPSTYTTGVGFKAGFLRLDYAFVMPPELSATHHFSASMEFNFNPSQVRIEKVQVRDLYASLYKSYASEPFGSARVRNLRDRPVTARLAVYVPELMDAPSEKEITLRPKATEEIPLTAVLSRKVMTQGGNRPVQVRVTTRYQSVRLPRTDKASARCAAYGPGAVSWDGGVAPAAAFVTTQDPAIDAFARQASRSVAVETERPFGTTNLAFAAAIFDALGALGVAYVPDPDNPYSSISETPHAVDTIQYPRQTLATRAGDCDDTSVLLAALLENVGVPTQLVDVPGHIFLLVDTGIHERNRLALAVAENLYVVSGDEVWIPLETTALAKGFAEAWRLGAQIYQDAATRGVSKLVEVTAAQARFEPGEVPAGAAPASPAADTTQLRARLAADAGALRQWQEDFRAKRFQDVERHLAMTPQALNEIAHVYIIAGEFDDSRAKLSEALRSEPNSARTHNNLAVGCVAAGDMACAVQHFTSALAADSSDAGVWLNLGLVRRALGDSSGADEALATGVRRSGGYPQACRLLGLGSIEPTARMGVEQTFAASIASLLQGVGGRLREGAARVPRAKGAPSPVTGLEVSERMALVRVLYWKE